MSQAKKQKLNEFNFDLLKCALLTTHQKHHLKEPIPLSCGHNICKRCVPSNNDIIQCGFCNKINKFDLKDANESVVINQMLNLYLPGLFKHLERDFNETVIKLKEQVRNAIEMVDIQFECAKVQIEIKVESLKIDLDNICKNMHEELTQTRNNCIRQIKEFFNEKYENSLNYIKDELINENFENHNLNNLYQYDVELANLKQLYENMKNMNRKIDFETSLIQLNESVVGTIVYSDPHFVKTRNGIYDSKILVRAIDDFCQISQKHMVTCNYNTRKIYLNNENLDPIENSKLNEVDFEPYSLTTNLKDTIYFTCHAKHRVCSIDFNFNLLKTAGSYGSSLSQFNEPCGLCFKNDLIYVCDLQNKRIKVLYEDLSLKKFHKLSFNPWYIEIIDNTACIRSNDPKSNSIYFFDINSFELRNKYDGQNGSICTVDNYFYEFYYENKTIYCYNSDGLLKDTTKLIVKNDIVFNRFDRFTYFDNNFIITSNEDPSQIILF